MYPLKRAPSRKDDFADSSKNASAYIMFDLHIRSLAENTIGQGAA